MKTWGDFIDTIIGVDVPTWIFGLGDKEFDIELFKFIISKKPHLINEYKHLLNFEGGSHLKEILESVPQTKIYLK